MAPQRLYELPNEQLVRLLGEARDLGKPFELAWREAVRPKESLVLTNTRDAPEGCVRWPTDSSDRIAWREAIFELKDEFRRAYQRRPATARERAVTILVDVLLVADQRRDVARGIGASPAVRSAA